MQIVQVYERKSSRHGWRLLIERPTMQREFVIEWAKDWRSRLATKWLPRQLGYMIVELAQGGTVRNDRPLKANDPRIQRIE